MRGNPLVTGEFPAQMAINTQSIDFSLSVWALELRLSWEGLTLMRRYFNVSKKSSEIPLFIHYCFQMWPCVSTWQRLYVYSNTGIVDSPRKRSVMRKTFPCLDVFMNLSFLMYHQTIMSPQSKWCWSRWIIDRWSGRESVPGNINRKCWIMYVMENRYIYI